METQQANLQDQMVSLDGGVFRMGSDSHYPEEAPAHLVRVGPFEIDRAPVTNRAFARFVAETGYVTLAERPPGPVPGADPALLVPGSVVLVPPDGPVDMSDISNWWQYIPGANWLRPRGPSSSLDGLGDHPVVHVAYEDALAYARWVGKDLPTEAEWEYAARGGLRDATFAWGEELEPDGRHMANIWQGEFPYRNTEADGWRWTSPVGAFPPNGFGLVDMIGNVWEWTRDAYADRNRPNRLGTCCSGRPRPSNHPARKVVKGGSHACAPNYCQRYRPAARMDQATDTSTSHIGFRCVRRLPR